MENEREPPKVFGRGMHRAPGGWTVVIGIVRFSIDYVTHSIGSIVANVSAGHGDESHRFGDEEVAIEWLESTARRIMRECLEIAGPMVAICNEREPEIFDGINIQKHYQVRFK